MADIVLLCKCGLRVKAPGATPGRTGRCPKCGGPLRVPEESPAPLRRNGVEPAEPKPPHRDEVEPDSPRRPRRNDDELAEPKRPSRRLRNRKSPEPISSMGGLLARLEHPEKGIFGSLLYPLRGAESMGVMAVLAVAIWMLGTALPEYLLSLMATASETGHSLLGILVSLITSIPFLIVAPLVIFYWLAYLGRVIVSGAKGETAPPRTPDRDFDGFLSALQPWFLWLFWGLGVGLAPSILVVSFSQPGTSSSLWLTAALGAFGYLYAMMALILAHVHGQALALSPLGIVARLSRSPFSFTGRCLAILVLHSLALAAAVASVMLRENYFWIYLPIRFLGCMSVAWASISSMRVLGIFAYLHRDDFEI